MSYSESHKKPGKGASYQDSFHSQKYRKMIWSLEKKYLIKILNDNFVNKKIVAISLEGSVG